jgi:hypothetical protein
MSSGRPWSAANSRKRALRKLIIIGGPEVERLRGELDSHNASRTPNKPFVPALATGAYGRLRAIAVKHLHGRKVWAICAFSRNEVLHNASDPGWMFRQLGA